MLETGAESGLAVLCAGLATMGAPALVLDAAGAVAYVTPAAAQLLARDATAIRGQPWAPLWADLCPGGPVLGGVPRRMDVRCGAATVAVRAWQRPVAGSPLTLVHLEDLSAEDAREREVLRIFRDSQQQADDLFALYQITQFLSAAQELDQLCAIFLRELERMTGAETACLYLATPPAGLAPQVWHGLAADPPAQPDSETAAAWLQARSGDQQVLALPLLAEERLIGLALLAHQGVSGRDLRFLHTVAREMGTALRAMMGRQALLAQEQKLEAIVMGTTDAIIQVAPGGRVQDFNRAAELLTGYTTADALDQSCAEVLSCADGAGCGGACPFAQVLASREPIPYAELLVRAPHGPRHVAASVAALDLDPHDAPAAVAILRDMTEQKQIEQMKSDFLITVSHQLRTPLALLRGYSETLRHLDLTPREQSTCVTGIAEATERLARLVEQILDVTRIEDGRLELHREPVRLVDVVRRAITGLPYTAYRSRVWAEVAPDLPLLAADPQRLEQVVLNLLDNALKYSSPAGPVLVRARAGAGYVELQVRDEGIGVPAADQAGLFTKFQRAENARRLQVPGTGLGLFICRSIVEAHGGRISLESTPGAGTCVTCRLPIHLEGT
ncbi:MAG TPA: ATP-binding protein [Chloroflexia bacterium]|nr:ATP-binding protein [Chloroflexia bacterium]